MKLLLFVLLSRLGVNALFRRLNRGRIKILVYHNVTPGGRGFTNSIDPSAFDAQLRHIKTHYAPVALTQDGAWRGYDPNRVNVLITFDDGFINNYEVVLPLLRKHSLPACFFLVASCVREGRVPGFDKRYMRPSDDMSAYRTVDPAMARDMMASGMTIGSHSLDHRDFSTLSDDVAVRDAEDSQRQLSELLQTPVGTLALPWGRSTAGQCARLRQSFVRILTTDHGFNGLDDWLLRRNEVAGTYHMFATACGSLDWLTGRVAVNRR